MGQGEKGFFILYLSIQLGFLTIYKHYSLFLKKKVNEDCLVELWDIFIFFLYSLLKKPSTHHYFFFTKSVILKNNLVFF